MTINRFYRNRVSFGGIVYEYSEDQIRWYEFNPVPSQKIINHSPDGFNQGYNGSGPLQLSLALLLDVFRSEKIALNCYKKFCALVVSKLQVNWKLTSREIRVFVQENFYDQLPQDSLVVWLNAS